MEVGIVFIEGTGKSHKFPFKLEVIPIVGDNLLLEFHNQEMGKDFDDEIHNFKCDRYEVKKRFVYVGDN